MMSAACADGTKRRPDFLEAQLSSWSEAKDLGWGRYRSERGQNDDFSVRLAQIDADLGVRKRHLNVRPPLALQRHRVLHELRVVVS